MVRERGNGGLEASERKRRREQRGEKETKGGRTSACVKQRVEIEKQGEISKDRVR